MNGKVRIFLAADPSGKPQTLDEDHKLYWAARVALRNLNYAQTEFAFDFSRHKVRLRSLEKGEHYLWSELVTEMAKHGKLGGHHVLLIDQPVEDNWFSRTFIEERLTIISTWSWEYISDLPMAAFIGYELVENLVERLSLKDSEAQNWFLKNVVHTGGARGCLNDLCEIKPQISLKIRTGDVCPDCLEVLRWRLSSRQLSAVTEMLECVRLIALNRQVDGPPSRDEFAADSAVSFSRRTGRTSLPATSIKTATSKDGPTKAGWKLRPDSGSEFRIVRQVDTGYPFPIAYCLRMMRSEQTYTRKWLHMYDVYRLIIKYLAFALLADLRQLANEAWETNTGSSPHNIILEELSDDLSKLIRGSDGAWGKVAFDLVGRLSKTADQSFFLDFANSIEPDDLREAQLASRAFVHTRNDRMQGHAFTPPEPVCRQFCEKHFDDLKTLLNFIKPIAKYQMLIPAGEVRKEKLGWKWNAKKIVGSNPTFEVDQFHTLQHPGDDCVLLSDTGKLLTLSPWLLLDYCPSCFREMVFLYDKLDDQEAVYREYPTNHMRNNRELGEAVRTILKP
jgi:hypothetical protein